MDTFPIGHADRPPFAFEVENVYVTPWRAARILRTIPMVTNVRLPRLFRRGECRVEFDYQGRACVVAEPFGDNSRYWIGPHGPKGTAMGDVDMTTIEEAFLAHRPSLLLHILGNLVSLRPFKRRTSLRYPL
jgi:hypothetical protein